jgi:chromosome segregation ATPase
MNGTPISARSAVKKPSVSHSSSFRIDPVDQDSRAESASLMDSLRERLQLAETAADEARRQNEALQARLDDRNEEQAKHEERMHEDEERIEELKNAKRELLKQKRELEAINEAERAAVMKDRDATGAREEELQAIIQRLKDSLAQKDSNRAGAGAESDVSRNGEPADLLSFIFYANQGLN